MVSTVIRSEQEPFPLDGNKRHLVGSREYDARLKYITNRVDVYIDRFRDLPLYDFTNTSYPIEAAQNACLTAYQQYAAGSLSLKAVSQVANNLLLAFARPKAQPPAINKTPSAGGDVRGGNSRIVSSSI